MLSISALIFTSASIIFVSNKKSPDLRLTDAYNGFACRYSGSPYYDSIKSNFIRLANDIAYEGCKGSQNNLADEYYGYVVEQSAARGVNPAFALTIWLAESGASNYCMGGSKTKDFGMGNASYKNVKDQLSKFLNLPYADGYNNCRQKSGWKEPMHAFLSRFAVGGCDPYNSTGTKYYNKIRNIHWQWVTGTNVCVTGGGQYFAISWPTDRCCP